MIVILMNATFKNQICFAVQYEFSAINTPLYSLQCLFENRRQRQTFNVQKFITTFFNDRYD